MKRSRLSAEPNLAVRMQAEPEMPMTDVPRNMDFSEQAFYR